MSSRSRSEPIREERAHDLVERREGAEGRLYDGAQLLPILIEEAARPARVELREHPRQIVVAVVKQADNHALPPAAHAEEDEHLHHAPKPLRIRAASEHEEILATREEDGQARE